MSNWFLHLRDAFNVFPDWNIDVRIALTNILDKYAFFDSNMKTKLSLYMKIPFICGKILSYDRINTEIK